MAPASTFAALQKMYKTVYIGRNLANQSKFRTPLYDRISKYDDFDGEGLKFPFNQGLPVGFGTTLATAQANPKPSIFDGWNITSVKPIYGILTIDALSMKRARKDIGAWLRLRQKETREHIDYLKMVLGGHAFWGDGAGDMAQVVSVTGADPVTSFTVAQTLTIRFHINQRLQFATSANRTGGSLKNAATVYTVTGVNRKTGVITVTRSSGTSAGDPAATDFAYLESSYDALPKGIQAFIPASDPGVGGVPAALFGMTRTDDPVMKAGWRGTWEGSIEESAKNLAALMGQYFTSEASGLWLSRYNWFRLEQELTAQNRKIMDQKATAYFGTPALALLTPEGEVPVMADPFCPNDAGFLLDHEQIEVHHVDPVIHVVDDDGLGALRMTADDGIEIRLRGWSENIIQRPFKCGRFPVQ